MSSQQPPKIAVVGMAVKYAGAKNKDEFWKTLNERTLNTKPITAKRLGTNDKDFHMSKVRSKFADKFNMIGMVQLMANQKMNTSFYCNWLVMH